MVENDPLSDFFVFSGRPCFPKVDSATSPLDYIDGLPDKKEGNDVLRYEQQGPSPADEKLRGGVEVKLGEGGFPEGDRLAEYDFLRESIESYR
jgi:hypothetical protein